ncbi:metal ABC transporter solute-binding protein, Zn/Mn family [Jeotgalibacillus marinus]|uniref:Zinc ABC transporter substrate-binding protein n=1 Tax=Jeotgalibacillus marinus TaxID=86667 RepID=A0ABV3Q404_9BACL
MKKLKTMLGLSVLSIALVGCSEAQEGDGDTPIRIVTTTSQIGDSIEQIGGELVEVTSLMGPGVDPHTYQATQNDIQSLQNADLVLYNGLHLEGRMNEIFEQMGPSKSVALGDSIDEEKLLKNFEYEGAVDLVDPHIWFDVDIWKEALDIATETLIQHLPEDEDQLKQRQQDYFNELDELIAQTAQKMDQLSDEQRVLVTAHDAFGYFGRMHDLEVIGLQGLSTEDEIGIRDIDSTIEILVERNIPSVFVESSISPRSIQAVIEGAKEKGHDVTLGGELFSDAMGEKGTKEGTYIGMYEHNVETIVNALLREEE